MISLHCTHCQKVLTLDEAFAGGVCRCQHCGTIQTVPSHLKKGPRASRSGPAARTLYRNEARDDSIAAPADAATSTHSPDVAALTRAADPNQAPRRSAGVYVAVGVIVLAVVAAAVLVWVFI